MKHVRIGPSRIYGDGLFATSAITKGQRILRYTGEKIPRAESDRRLAAGNDYIFGFRPVYGPMLAEIFTVLHFAQQRLGRRCR